MSEIVNKRYAAINRQNLILVVKSDEIPGKTFSITFTTGYGILHPEAYFITNNPILQKVLENDPRFNDSYRLIQINGVELPEYYARQALAKQKASMPILPSKEDEQPEVEKQPVFSNVQAAKEWMNKKFDIPFSQINNKTKLLTKAKELNIKFILETEKV
jgi:hypothetical protein